MASIIEAIRRLSIQATTRGVVQSTAELEKLAAAQGGVAVASQATERATLSLDQKFAAMEKRYIASVRQAAEFEKAQRLINQAVAQNPALQERANAVLAALNDKFDKATGSQKAFGIAASTVNLQIASLASELGVTGQILSAFGPWGFAAAVGIGAVQSALNLASDKAHELAQKSKEIFEFSEATGLSTRAFQALRAEAGKFGVDSETLAGGLQKFSVGFEALRLGEGALLENIRRVNPALADQMQRTTDAAEAFTLFGKAVAATDNIFQRNALLKAGLGRGSAIFGAFLENAPDVVKLQAAYDAAGKGIDKNMIEKLRQLQIDIDRTKSAANNTFAGLFGAGTLEAELEFQKGLLTIATTLKGMELSPGLQKFIDFVTHPATLGVLAAIAAAGAISAGVTIGGVALGGLALGAVGAAGYNAIRETGRAANDNTGYPAGSVSSSPLPPLVTAPAGKTPEALAADWKNLVGVLGSAATPSERLAAAFADLSVKAKQANSSAETLARAQGGLKLDAAIEQQNAHNAALGASATIYDLVHAKALQLQKLQQQGAGLTSAQIQFQLKLTAAQALGTYQIDAQTDAEKVRAATMFMSTEAGLAYSIVQTRINDGLRNGNPLTAEQIAQLQSSADAYAKVRTSADSYAEALSTISSSVTSNMVTGLADITDGTKSASDGFRDMSRSIVRAIEEMVIKMMIVTPIVKSLQSALGGLGFGSAELPGWGSSSFVGPLASAKGNVFANDNVVPFASGGVFTNTIVDRPTVFPFAKGVGLMGEAGPEAIMPLQRGADGRLGVSTSGGSGTPSLSFGDINITLTGTGGGSADELARAAPQIRQTVADAVDERMRYHGRARGMLA